MPGSAAVMGGNGGGDGGNGGAGGGNGGGGAGGDQKPFWDGFKTPEVKELMQAKNYADPEALGTAYFNLNKLQNGAKDVIAIPGEKATPEDWGKVFAALGRPESADKIELKVAEGMTVDEPFMKFARGLLYDLGADNKRGQAAFDKWQGYVAERVKEMAKAEETKAEQQITEMKGKWQGGEWDANIAAGQKAVKGLQLPDEILNGLDKALGVPAVMQLLAAIGRGVGKEDNPPGGGGGGGSNANGMTPEQARTEIAKLQADKAFQDALFDKKHTDFKAKNEHWNKLHEIAYPPVKKA